MGCLQNQKLPQWVKDMVDAEFFTGKGKNPNYRGYFCVECGGKSLRKVDVENEHCDHKVLQALSCSREYGYNMYDVLKISGLSDYVSGVCPYKVNNGFVYFPKSRKKNDKNSPAIKCVVCLADLSKAAKPNCDRFCSILCKINSGFGLVDSVSTMLQKNEICLGQEDIQDSLKLKIKIRAEGGFTKGKDTKNLKRKRSLDGDVSCRGLTGNAEQPGSEKLEDLISAALGEGKKANNVCLSFRKRSRKGKPCRAPLF